MPPDDLCPRPQSVPPFSTQPHSPPIYLTSVWACDSPQQADDILGGRAAGHVYQRDTHPNADLLAAKCGELHGAERAVITSSGMSALSAALLTQLQPGEHLVIGSRSYGKSLALFVGEGGRLGIQSTVVDAGDLQMVAAAITPRTRLLVVETIANPLLEVADIAALAKIAHQAGARLLVDNTFASPLVCRPLDLGADLVMESLTKSLNGHSDVVLGLLCGRAEDWKDVPRIISTWGLNSSPFDCWLAGRGLLTAHLRMERGCQNAMQVAEFLGFRREIKTLFYPGLQSHPGHLLAAQQFRQGLFGCMVTFELSGGRSAADAFIVAARRIPFCPSLGELSTTLSHPETTSHRGLTPEQRAALGISGGVIRLSVGTESADFICSALAEGLDAIKE